MYGALTGTDPSPRYGFVPLDTTGLSGRVLAVACGGAHTLVLTTEGVFGCGFNHMGQLGLSPERSNIMTSFTRLHYGLEGVPQRIAAGLNHTMILTDIGLFVCGDDKYGQLGTGESTKTVTSVYRLVQVPNLPRPDKIISFSGGAMHSLVHCADGLYGSGTAYNGIDKQDTRLMHQLVLPQLRGTLVGATCGYSTTVVWTTKCCYVAGNNTHGQLGYQWTYDDVERIRQLTPLTLDRDSDNWANVVAASCSGNRTLIVKRDGSVYMLPDAIEDGRTEWKYPSPVALPDVIFSSLLPSSSSNLACRQCGQAACLREASGLKQRFCADVACQRQFYTALLEAK
jgi:alpha-tubulin suppressor-like RCC1 family protein